ncbi:MAG TPA: hypothetical protein VLJ58_04020 [Ramlibacter sp.]|nr:hypothetical protein [Ramlibacter sp.]
MAALALALGLFSAMSLQPEQLQAWQLAPTLLMVSLLEPGAVAEMPVVVMGVVLAFQYLAVLFGAELLWLVLGVVRDFIHGPKHRRGLLR